MKTEAKFHRKGLKRLSLALAGAALLTLAGCGGSPGGAVPEATTQDVVTRVVDGAISNALVCLDKNGNGACDAGEPNGRTDGSGNLTLKVDKTDVGKYALVTEVGTDAVDTVEGPVTSPFVMTSTPGKPGVLSPLTTMVAQAMQNGLTEADAEAQIKDQTGISVSLFEDFTKAAPPSSGPKPGDVARIIVLTTQAQNEALKASVGGQAIDGSTITGADLKKAVNKKIMSLLPTIVEAINSNTAGGTVDKSAVLNAVKTSFLTDAAIKTQVGIEKAAAIVEPPAAITSGYSLTNLSFSDSNNWFRRTLNGTLAQNTPDASGLRRYVERRERTNTGVLATWNSFNEPNSQANLHWNGSTWVGCSLNQESQATVPDAQGLNKFNFCDNYSSGSSKRATFDISGKKMIDVYTQIRDAGYTNLDLFSNAATLLGATNFPADSKIQYVESQTAKTAFGINPGLNSLIIKNPQSVGGDARPVGSNNICAQNTGAQNALVNTLEEMVATFTGTPCIYNQGSISNVNGTFTSNGSEVVWGQTSLNIGNVGNAPLLQVPSSYFTTNYSVRLAFTNGGPNEVTFYTCKQRQINGFTRNCVPTGEKATWSIETLPDGARVMSFSAAPTLASPFTYVRTFVQRNGKVVFGYKDKLGVSNSARLNTVAGNALAAKLGIPANDPDVPLALTAASYQGAWSVNDVGLLQTFTTGTTLNISATNTVDCNDRSNNFAPFACTLTITNPATGAFSGTSPANAVVFSGTLGFFTGMASGTYSDQSQPITPFTGGRR